MFKEVFKRSLMFNPDVEIQNTLFERMKKDDDYKLYVVGHLHEQKVMTHGNRKLIQSGCFRDEFMYSEKDQTFTLIPKSYLEIWMQGPNVACSNMLELQVADIPEHRVPTSINQYKEIIENKLGTADDRLKNRIDIESQEEKEKDED